MFEYGDRVQVRSPGAWGTNTETGTVVNGREYGADETRDPPGTVYVLLDNTDVLAYEPTTTRGLYLANAGQRSEYEARIRKI